MQNEIDELRKAANNSRKAQNFTEALKDYQRLWNSHRDQCNEWDGWGYAHCLRKTGQVQQALKICKEVYKMNPAFQPNNNLYGWCVYDFAIKKDDTHIKQDEGTFFKAVDKIITLTDESSDNILLRSLTVFRAVKYLKNNRQAYPAKEIIGYLNNLSPQQLSSQPKQGKDDKGNPINYASDLESWYMERTKALFTLKQYDECIQCCDEALKKVTKFHTNNNIWLIYRKALCLSELGKIDDALALLQDILSKKKEWFILRDYAVLLHKKGALDEALSYAIRSALTPSNVKLSYRWELFFLLGNLFQAKGEVEKAKDHYLLAAKLRKEEGWKPTNELNVVIQKFKISIDDKKLAKELHRELEKVWKEILAADPNQLKGKVIKLNDGKFGFIKGEDNNEYFFRVNNVKKHDRSKLALGCKVKFYKQPSQESGKKDIAIDIEIE